MNHTQETPQQRLERQTTKLEAMRYGKRPKNEIRLKKFLRKQIDLALSASFLKKVMHEVFVSPSEVHYFRDGGMELVNKDRGEVVLPSRKTLNGIELSIPTFSFNTNINPIIAMPPIS